MANESNGRDGNEVDPWRFAGGFLANMLGKSIPEEPSHAPIPWTAFEKPLSGAKVSLLSTAGISMKDDEPFDMEFERQHPTRGDSSFRRLRADATSGQIEANHLHIEVGSLADTHYSIMGFQGSDSSQLENESAPAIAEIMKSEEVDLALLAPV
jgi:hypothetical protein